MKKYCKNCDEEVEVNPDHIEYNKCLECGWIIPKELRVE